MGIAHGVCNLAAKWEEFSVFWGGGQVGEGDWITKGAKLRERHERGDLRVNDKKMEEMDKKARFLEGF